MSESRVKACNWSWLILAVHSDLWRKEFSTSSIWELL